MARLELSNGHYVKARRMAELVRRQLTEQGSREPALAQAQLLSGIACQFIGEQGFAEEYLEQATLSYTELGLTRDALLCESYRARYIGEYGDLHRAHHIAAKALEQAVAGGHRDLEARLLLSLGTIEMKLADYPAARQCIEQALAYCQELGDDACLQHACLLSSTVNALSGRLAESQTLFSEGAEAARLRRDAPQEAWLRLNLGSVLYRLQHWEESRLAYKEAIRLARDCSLGQVLAYAHLGLGLTELRRNDRRRARNHLLRAQQQALKGGFSQVENQSQLYLGILNLFDNRVADALNCFSLTLNGTHGGDQPGWARSYQAVAYLLSGYPELALRLFAGRLPVEPAQDYLDDRRLLAELVRHVLDSPAGTYPDLSSEGHQILLNWRDHLLDEQACCRGGQAPGG